MAISISCLPRSASCYHVLHAERAEGEAEAEVGFGAGKGRVIVGLGEVAEFEGGLAAVEGDGKGRPLAGDELHGLLGGEGDGFMIGAVGGKGSHGGAGGAEDDSEDMAIGPVAGEDDGFDGGIRFEGHAEGGIGVGEVVKEDGAVILVLFEELVVLCAGGGVIGELPFTTHGAA